MTRGLALGMTTAPPNDDWLATASGRVHGGRDLVPDFQQVAVAVAGEQVRLARTEFALLHHRSAGRFDRSGRGRNVGWIGEAKSEVSDRAGTATTLRRPLEHENVASAGRLRLQEVVASVDGNHPENRFVKPERALDVRNAECKMGEAEGLDHSNTGRAWDHGPAADRFSRSVPPTRPRERDRTCTG